MKKNSIIDDLCKDIPLEIRIRVLNEIVFINLIYELGYRENKIWTPEEDEILNKLLEFAEIHTKDIMEEINNSNG